MSNSLITRIAGCAILALLFPLSLFGQFGTSSMSMGMSRAGLIPSSQSIRVEELINYHRHLIPVPDGQQRVALDMQWRQIEGRSVVQVGLATASALDPETMPPLNLVLVIDRSGSMSGERIAKVKQALLSFVERLRKDDLVTIVSFSNSATVDLSATRKSDQSKIVRTIERLNADGSTNLHGGLMLGYEQAKKHFDDKRSNRVILLTDGIANVGTTDSEAIARESKAFNNMGIDLSTIGLGADFNQELLRNLADAGRGLIHFVNDEQDIEKSFIREIDSLLAPAARDVHLEIRSTDASPRKVFGYEPTEDGEAMHFELDNLNQGATQVVMTEWKQSSTPVRIKATLKYTDALTGKPRKTTRTIVLNGEERPAARESDLLKNYTIAVIAASIQDASRQVEKEEYRKAIKKLDKGLRFARADDLEEDEDVARVMQIASSYRSTIDDALESTSLSRR